MKVESKVIPVRREVKPIRYCIKSHDLSICVKTCPLYKKCWGE